MPSALRTRSSVEASVSILPVARSSLPTRLVSLACDAASSVVSRSRSDVRSSSALASSARAFSASSSLPRVSSSFVSASVSLRPSAASSLLCFSWI
jgi:hypothetical protein